MMWRPKATIGALLRTRNLFKRANKIRSCASCLNVNNLKLKYQAHPPTIRPYSSSPGFHVYGDGSGNNSSRTPNFYYLSEVENAHQMHLTDLWKHQQIQEAITYFDTIRQGERCITHWNTMIRGFAQAKIFDEMEYYFTQMKFDGWTPNLESWACRMMGYAAQGDEERVLELYHQLKTEANLAPTARIFNIIIRMYGKQSNLESMFKYVDLMEYHGCDKNLATYHSVMASLAQQGQDHRVRKVFETMKQGGWRPNNYTFDILMNAINKSKSVEDKSMLSKSAQLVELYSEMREYWALEPNLNNFNTLLRGLAADGSFDLVEEFLELMEELDIQPNIKTYNILMHAIGQTPKQALYFMDQLKERGLVPSHVTYNTLLNALAASGDIKAVHSVFLEFRELYNPSTRTVAAVLKACGRSGETELMMKLFNDMEQNGIPVEAQTMNILISGFALAHDSTGMERIFTQLRNRHYLIDAASYNPMLRCYGHLQQPALMINCLFDMLKSNVEPDSLTMLYLTEALYFNKSWKQLFDLYRVVYHLPLPLRPSIDVPNWIMKTVTSRNETKRSESTDSEILALDKTSLHINFHKGRGSNYEELRELFTPFGAITRIKIFPRRHFAYVDFDNPESAQNALTALNKQHVQSGSKMKIKFAKPPNPSQKAETNPSFSSHLLFPPVQFQDVLELVLNLNSFSPPKASEHHINLLKCIVKQKGVPLPMQIWALSALKHFDLYQLIEKDAPSWSQASKRSWPPDLQICLAFLRKAEQSRESLNRLYSQGPSYLLEAVRITKRQQIQLNTSPMRILVQSSRNDPGEPHLVPVFPLDKLETDFDSTISKHYAKVSSLIYELEQSFRGLRHQNADTEFIEEAKVENKHKQNDIAGNQEKYGKGNEKESLDDGVKVIRLRSSSQSSGHPEGRSHLPFPDSLLSRWNDSFEYIKQIDALERQWKYLYQRRDP